MKSNYISGGILVILGLVLFGVTNDWINIELSIRTLAKFWPLLIVGGGLAAFLHPKKSVYNPLTALLIAFAIPLGIYNSTAKVIDDVKEDINDEWNIDIDDSNDDNDDDTYSKLDSADFEGADKKFSVPYKNDISEINLEIKGGAAAFNLEESVSDQTIEGYMKNFDGRFEVSDEVENGKQDISVNMKSSKKSIRFGNKDNNDHEVLFKLNTKPTYDLKLDIGAGQVNFDLSKYKIKRLDLNTGAADINLKLGELLTETTLDIDSGVAKLNLDVPKGVGCRIQLDGALNAKNFDGFKKVGNGTWESDNYASSTKKISIKLDSGLSVVDVDRY